MPSILRALVEASSRDYSPTIQNEILWHAVDLIAYSTKDSKKAYSAFPGAVEFLVAGLRSRDWALRVACFNGLLFLHLDAGNDYQKGFTPVHLVYAEARPYPSNLQYAMSDYGYHKCEAPLAAKASGDFHRAMMEYGRDRDLYSLGLKLVPIILSTEFSVTDAFFEAKDLAAAKNASRPPPFNIWGDALPHCARAIREKGNPEERDLADILELKHLVIRNKMSAAVALAKRAVERSPDQGYFWHVLTLDGDNVRGLRAAKKGLKAKQLSPFCKWQILQRGITHAGNAGMVILQHEKPDEHSSRFAEALAILTSALDHARIFLEEAPPDNRHMKMICYWAVILTVMTSEEEMTDLMSSVQVRFVSTVVLCQF